MTATPVMFIKAGQTYFNVAQIWRVVVRDDGTAWLFYGGGDSHLILHLGATEADAVAALNVLLTPVDVTPYL